MTLNLHKSCVVMSDLCTETVRKCAVNVLKNYRTFLVWKGSGRSTFEVSNVSNGIKARLAGVGIRLGFFLMGMCKCHNAYAMKMNTAYVYEMTASDIEGLIRCINIPLSRMSHDIVCVNMTIKRRKRQF